MKKLLFILFTLLTILAKAQTAENFTLTSTDGITYTLFEQLDSNKIVILDFFSVGCSTCQENTPYLDSLWQQYGYNGDSVWFWGIESYYADSQQIEDFRQQYGATFPCFSTKEDTTVLGLYNITYTPQYYITCPDHSAKKIYKDQIETYILNCKQNIVTSDIIDNTPHFIYTTNGKTLVIHNYDKQTLNVELYNITGTKIKATSLYPSTTKRLTVSYGGIYIVHFYSANGNFNKSYKIIFP